MPGSGCSDLGELSRYSPSITSEERKPALKANAQIRLPPQKSPRYRVSVSRYGLGLEFLGKIADGCS